MTKACAILALAGAIAWAGGADSAEAQTSSAGVQPPAGAPDDPVFLDAGTVINDRENQMLFARGGVRMQTGNRLLIADEIEYNAATGRVIARGNVQLSEGGAPAQLAYEIELDEEMSEGVAYGFATLLENNGKAAAAVAVRRADGSVELTDGYYTACDLCEDGSGRPTWRLRAGKVVRDLDDQMVYYRDVRLEIFGAPILYAPAFAHADPSTERRSGFLIPTIDISDRLGFSYTQPYLWVISPSSDLVIAPRYMSEVNPGLELDFRKRFFSGEIAFEGSITYEQEFDEDGFFGEEDVRWHTFAEGGFDITNTWRWGFGVQETSEDLYLRRYDFTEMPDLGAGLYEVENRFLASQIYTQARGANYYADLAALRITSLRENQDDDTIPRVAPIGRFSGAIPLPDWLGTLGADASVAALERELGDDYARVSLGTDYSRVTILPGGVRAEPYAIARVDSYSVNETDALGEEISARDFTRTLGAAGLDVSWPFARFAGWGDAIIAPRGHFVAASGLEEEEIAPNEDSQAVDLDSISLFARNRAGGYDIWEDGTRADLGLDINIDTFRTWVPDIDLFAGRSLRLDDDPVFATGTGLDQSESDWIAEIGLDLSGISFDARNRFDSETGDLNRTDILAAFDFERFSAEARYAYLPDETDPDNRREDLRIRTRIGLTERWSVGAQAQHDFDDEITRTARAFISYRDECTEARIVYERRNFDVGNLGESNSIRFEVAFFTLGTLQEE